MRIRYNPLFLGGALAVGALFLVACAPAEAQTVASQLNKSVGSSYTNYYDQFGHQSLGSGFSGKVTSLTVNVEAVGQVNTNNFAAYLYDTTVDWYTSNSILRDAGIIGETLPLEQRDYTFDFDREVDLDPTHEYQIKFGVGGFRVYGSGDPQSYPHGEWDGTEDEVVKDIYFILESQTQEPTLPRLPSQPSDDNTSTTAAPYWYQTLGKGLDGAIKDLTIRVRNTGDAYYAGSITGYHTSAYENGYGNPPIETYGLQNLGAATPAGFDGYVTLTSPSAPFPFNPNLYYKLSLNAGDTSRSFSIGGTGSDSYSDGKAYYAYSSYPCGQYFNPETTCEEGADSGIADIFFNTTPAEVLSGTETAITEAEPRRPQYSPDIDGDVVVWIDSPNGSSGDIVAYEISTGNKTRITNDATVNRNRPVVADRKIVWYESAGVNLSGHVIYLHDLDTGITTEVTGDNVGITSLDFDGERIVWQRRYYDYGVYMHDVKSAATTFVGKSDGGPGAKISGDYILYEGTKWLNLYNISTGETVKTFIGVYGTGYASVTACENYDIDGDYAVCVGKYYPTPKYKIAYRKLSTGEEHYTAGNIEQGGSSQGISTSDGKIVWSNGRDIFMYDIATGKTGRAGMSADPSIYPRISQNNIVWQERWGDVSNIFRYEIGGSNARLQLQHPVWIPTDGEKSLKPGDEITKGIIAMNTSSPDVTLNISGSVSKTGGDDELCQTLELVAHIDGEKQYEGALLDFAKASPHNTEPGASETWLMQVSLPDDAPARLSTKTCQFDFEFMGTQVPDGDLSWWQKLLGHNAYALFTTDTVTDSNTITAGEWKYPIIVIPGILGTQLWQEQDGVDNLIWIDKTQVGIDLLDPEDTFLYALEVDSDGNSKNPIRTGDLLRQSFVNYYGDLMVTLAQNGLWEDVDVFTFPYDWRLDNKKSAAKLATFIEEVLQDTNARKVDIVAHSMGGLVTRYYASFSEVNANNIRKIIYLGTPHKGSANAFNALAFDDLLTNHFMPLDFISSGTMSNLSKTLPAVYQLLPQFEFLTIDQENLSLDDTYTIDPGGLGKLTMNTTHLPSYNQMVSDLNTDRNIKSVKQYTIAGSGTATLKELEGVSSAGELCWIPHAGNGDKTVLIEESASAVFGDNAEVFYRTKINDTDDPVEHANLPNDKSVGNLVAKIFKDEPYRDGEGNWLIAGFSDDTTELSTGSVLKWGTCSPVHTEITDNAGNRNGRNEHGSIEENIPASSFFSFNDSEGGFLPASGRYTMNLRAFESGTFDLIINKAQPDGTTENHIEYSAVPIAQGSVSTVQIEPALDVPTMSVDIEGDGVVDYLINPSEEVPTQYYLATLRHAVIQLDLDERIERRILRRIDRIERALNRGKDEAVERRIEKLLKRIGMFEEKGKLNPDEADELERLIEAI